jgi:hypothetical protein
MTTESADPESSRTRHPGSYFAGILILLVSSVLVLAVRHFNIIFLIFFFLPTSIYAITALYFGERTFFSIKASQWMDRVSPQTRRNLRIAQKCFFWLFIVNITIDVVLLIASQPYGFAFQTTGFAFLILSYSVADFLGEPMNRPHPPVTLKI